MEETIIPAGVFPGLRIDGGADGQLKNGGDPAGVIRFNRPRWGASFV